MAISTRRYPVWRNPEQALYRELREEIGLLPEHVRLLRKPKAGCAIVCRIDTFVRIPIRSVLVKTKVVLLKLTAPAQNIQLNLSDPPEFDQWQWVSYWYPLGQVVNFKRDVYRKALVELCQQLPQQNLKNRINNADFYLAIVINKLNY